MSNKLTIEYEINSKDMKSDKTAVISTGSGWYKGGSSWCGGC